MANMEIQGAINGTSFSLIHMCMHVQRTVGAEPTFVLFGEEV